MIKKDLALQLAPRVIDLVRARSMKAGEPLREQTFAQALGVSRSPIRRVFALLAEWDLAIQEPNRGYFLKQGAGQIQEAAVPCASDPFEDFYLRVVDDILGGEIPTHFFEAQLLRRYEVPRGQLLKVLNRLANGVAHITPHLGARILASIGSLPALEAEADTSILSKRESEIYVLIRRGCCNKEIGRSLNLSEKTVKHYLTNIFRKLDVRNRTELAATPLNDDPGMIPSLEAVLDLVAGQVPLLIEIKDQDGQMGPNIGQLETATAKALTGYAGDVAVMSFNPHSVLRMSELAPGIARGITPSRYEPVHWPELPPATRDLLRLIPDYDRTGACFISHEASDLNSPRVAELKAQGAHILCWTIRSPEAEAAARKVAQNVTFEGYRA